MGTILTGETLQDLKESDRITYHGVRWQVRGVLVRVAYELSLFIAVNLLLLSYLG